MRATFVQRFAAVLTVLAAVIAAIATAPRPAHAEWSRTRIDVNDPSDLAAARFGGATFVLAQEPDFFGEGPSVVRIRETGSPQRTFIPSFTACDARFGGELVVAYEQLHLFVQRDGGGLCHWFTTDGSRWHGPDSLVNDVGGSTGYSIAATMYGGNLHVFNTGSNGELRQVFWDAPAQSWHALEPADPTMVAADPSDDPRAMTRIRTGIYNGQLHVVYLNDNLQLVDRWFDPAAGAWHTTRRFVTEPTPVDSGIAWSPTLGFIDAGERFDVETTFMGQFHITYIRADRVHHLWYDPVPPRPGWNTEQPGDGFLASTHQLAKLRTVNLGGQFQIVYGSPDQIRKPFWDPYANGRRGAWVDDSTGTDSQTGLRGLAIASEAGMLDIFAEMTLPSSEPWIEHSRWS